MKETRVDKYASYREEIDKIYEVSKTDKEESKISPLDETQVQLSFDDMIKKHDEYTVMFDSLQMAEKKMMEEKKKRDEKIRLVKNIILYVALGLVALFIIFLIVCILGGF